jgi:hypothetical protein
MSERKYPPVTGIAMTSLALIVAGGIYLSAHLPQHVPIGPAVVLLVLSAALMAYNIYSLTRVKDFPWARFFAVAKWSLAAYLIIAGLIEYAFLHNHLSGAPLVVLTLSLLIFAIHVPTLLGFTVARYYDPSQEAVGAPAA